MRFAWNLFKYLLAFGLLGWVLAVNWDPPSGNGLKQVYQRHFVEGVPIHLWYFGLAILATAGAVAVTFVRWYFLVRAMDLPFTLGSAFRLGLIGYFFSTFLPGSVGGDIIKAAAIAREQDKRTRSVATVLMDRAIALWALIWLVVAACLVCGRFGLVSPEAEPVVAIIFRTSAILLGITVAVWVLLGLLPTRRAERFRGRLAWIPKIGGPLAELWWAVWLYRQRPRAVLVALALSWVAQAGYALTIYCTAMTLWNGIDHLPSLGEHFLIVPIGLVIEALPLFPGGAGIGEAGFGGLYQLFGAAATYGVLASLLRRTINWSLGLVGYMVYLQMQARVSRPEEVPVPVTPEVQGATTP
jgi:uncharacterized membrane protein YbhN (UPF0104 family)